MINYIWGSFFIIGIIYSFLTGNVESINNEILDSASRSVKLILELLPIMCLWLGIMQIASDSGLIKNLSKKITPFIRILFPDIPSDDESLTFISSNIIMNMLGLGNAATPFGLKAMKSLQAINKNKDEASRSMITFLVINTASVTIIPTTVISFRILNGASNPTDIVTASIITTILSCIVGVLLDRLFYLLSKNRKRKEIKYANHI